VAAVALAWLLGTGQASSTNMGQVTVRGNAGGGFTAWVEASPFVVLPELVAVAGALSDQVLASLGLDRGKSVLCSADASLSGRGIELQAELAIQLRPAAPSLFPFTTVIPYTSDNGGDSAAALLREGVRAICIAATGLLSTNAVTIACDTAGAQLRPAPFNWVASVSGSTPGTEQLLRGAELTAEVGKRSSRLRLVVESSEFVSLVNGNLAGKVIHVIREEFQYVRVEGIEVSWRAGGLRVTAVARAGRRLLGVWARTSLDVDVDAAPLVHGGELRLEVRRLTTSGHGGGLGDRLVAGMLGAAEAATSTLSRRIEEAVGGIGLAGALGDAVSAMGGEGVVGAWSLDEASVSASFDEQRLLVAARVVHPDLLAAVRAHRRTETPQECRGQGAVGAAPPAPSGSGGPRGRGGGNDEL